MMLQDGGTFLAAVDDANEHVISVWDWQKSEKGHKVTETKVTTASLWFNFEFGQYSLLIRINKFNRDLGMYWISGIIRPGIRYPVRSGILNDIWYYAVSCIQLNLISGIIRYITNCCQTLPPPIIVVCNIPC